MSDFEWTKNRELAALALARGERAPAVGCQPVYKRNVRAIIARTFHFDTEVRLVATLDYDRAAAVLVEAAYQGDEAAAARWGVSLRTIRNYRARLEVDSQLAAFFHVKRELVERDWAAGLTDVIRAGAAFIRRAADEGDPSDPEMVHAVAGGMKLVAEILFAKQMLDARLRVLDAGDSREYRPNRPQIAAVATDGEFSDSDG